METTKDFIDLVEKRVGTTINETTAIELIKAGRKVKTGTRTDAKYVAADKERAITAVPPQMAAIINAFRAVTEPKTMSEIGEIAVAKHGLVTKQAPERIAKYYLRDMLGGSFIEESEKETEAKETEEKKSEAKKSEVKKTDA